ncbi:hypothetical protein ISU10_12655 [Nocardioides agariphilus]|uniref:Uncharacterized protein n=1 Tax=Nocardioides agariphilus TaxID=433664 RepID=A0A930YIZ2_9ACTN|nr:hypothetical protein [Nocardioides agariphilus]MBF4768613.1 hypothetical protein [Nocardioides agariphilus]
MSNLTGRQIMLLLGCALALITAAVGIYGLVRGPGGTNSDSTATNPSEVAVVVDSADPDVTLRDRSLPHTTDPVAYARAVAVSLFDWDTSAGFLPTDYTAAVLADADPSGEETPGLLDDVATYLPTVEQWLDLGVMEVVQTIDIGDAYVPDSWAAAVDQSHGHLRPGTTAVTITGTRQRSGVWNGEVAESSYPVSFTVFVACQPSFERCHVLRLSQVDDPLR